MKYFLLFFLVLIIISCAEWQPPSGPPERIKATETETDQIIISWNKVAGAGVYHIYRSAEGDRNYIYLDSTSATSYIDVEIDFAVTYWYKIQAADPTGRIETALSEPVTGIAEHIYEWDTSIISSGISGLETAVDDARNIFAVTPGSGGETPLTVYTENEEENWEQLGDPVGGLLSSNEFSGENTDGTFSIDAHKGIPYVAFLDARRKGKISIKYYSNEVWSDLGKPDFGSEEIDSLQILAEDDNTYLSFVETGTIKLYKWQTNNWILMDSLPPETNVVWFSILADVNGELLLITYSWGTDTVSGDDDLVVLYRYNGIDWTNLGTIECGIIPEGYIDAAANSEGSVIITAFYNQNTGLTVYEFSDEQWTGINPEDTFNAYSTAGTIAVGFEDSKSYLFYREDKEYEGIIRSYDGTNWSVLPLSEETQTITGSFGVSNFSLLIEDTRIYASYIEGNSAIIRIYR